MRERIVVSGSGSSGCEGGGGGSMVVLLIAVVAVISIAISNVYFRLRVFDQLSA